MAKPYTTQSRGLGYDFLDAKEQHKSRRYLQKLSNKKDRQFVKQQILAII